MKPYTKLIHKIILWLRVEYLFIYLKKYIPVAVKFIPLHNAYNGSLSRKVKRNNVHFNLLLSDYMQWHVYADLPDPSWKKASEYLADGSCMIDAGANCGAFTLKLAQKAFERRISKFKLYSFEPNPYVSSFLTANLKLNAHLADYVSILTLGLGNQEGAFHMDFSVKNTGGGKISSTGKPDAIQVQLTTLDKFVEQHKISAVGFIKMDVEGFEPRVIEGAAHTIRKFLPAVYLEITDSWFKAMNSSQYQIIRFFRDLSYSLYMEVDSEFVSLDKVETSLDRIFQYNLLAIPANYK